jgi:OHCU decarboxylase
MSWWRCVLLGPPSLEQLTQCWKLILLAPVGSTQQFLAAAAGEMTEESIGEQASAGLDRLAPSERARFTQLNDAYKARFGIPFIMAVAGASKDAILQAFETRLQSTPEVEFETALGQVERISLLRLKEIMATR